MKVKPERIVTKKDETPKLYLEHRGYALTQHANNHYTIHDMTTGRFVMHAQCTGELTVGEAREEIEEFLRFRFGELRVVLDPGAYIPVRGHTNDAGLDLISPRCYSILPWEHAVIDTGVHVQIPEGYVGRITSKSSLMDKGLLTTATIDAGYTGSIKVVLFNVSRNTVQIGIAQKVAQLVIHPIITPEVVVVDKLDETERGNGGFGSTGSFAEGVASS